MSDFRVEDNGTVFDATQVLMDMMETMRKQNEEQAEEFKRVQEEMRRESIQAREMLEESLRVQDHLQRRNEELEHRLYQQLIVQWEEGDDALINFSANKAKPLEVADLFEVKQAKKESIKQFLCRFSEVMVQISHPNERLFVEAFIRGLQSGLFGESLIERRPDCMAAVKIRAMSHIKAEEFTIKKREDEKRDEGVVNDGKNGVDARDL
ncbi:hypothetical protein VNO80_30309 [Phaseolus coccineus]|uniref:Retrotransposon gag domain-containing protein n=1 Tax=Phaseolus coccineus TaxID=3886 RepID=A0AAN9LG13_PHACN